MEIVPSPKGYFRMGPDKAAIEEATRLLAGASNPVIIVGDRVAQSQASQAVVRVAELLGAKVYATNFSEVNFPSGHPQFLGMLNPTLPASKEMLSSADAVLAVGTNVFSGFLSQHQADSR